MRDIRQVVEHSEKTSKDHTIVLYTDSTTLGMNFPVDHNFEEN